MTTRSKNCLELGFFFPFSFEMQKVYFRRPNFIAALPWRPQQKHPFSQRKFIRIPILFDKHRGGGGGDNKREHDMGARATQSQNAISKMSGGAFGSVRNSTAMTMTKTTRHDDDCNKSSEFPQTRNNRNKCLIQLPHKYLLHSIFGVIGCGKSTSVIVIIIVYSITADRWLYAVYAFSSADGSITPFWLTAAPFTSCSLPSPHKRPSLLGVIVVREHIWIWNLAFPRSNICIVFSTSNLRRAYRICVQNT